MRTRLFAAAVTGAVLVAGLTGCGSDDDDAKKMEDLSVEDIETETKSAMGDLKSVTYSMTQGSGESQSLTTVSAEIGGGCTGTVSVGDIGTEFIRLEDGASFMKADPEYWRAQSPEQADQIIDLLGEKWAKLPAAEDPFQEPCDLEGLIDSIVEDEDGEEEEPEITKGDVTEVDGRDALELTSVKDDVTSTLWIDNENGRMLRAEQGDELSMEFTDFDEEVEAEAPAEDDFVDLDKQ